MPDKGLQMSIRDKLNVIKGKHQLTNSQISDMSGVPLGTVNGIFSGQVASPSFAAVSAILIAMNVSIDDFCGHQALTDADIGALAAEPPAHQPMSQSDNLLQFSDEMKRVARDAWADVAEGEICSRMTADHDKAFDRLEKQHTVVCKHLEGHIKWWRAVALCMIALFMVMLLWDATHPAVGLIRYENDVAYIDWVDIRHDPSGDTLPTIM